MKSLDDERTAGAFVEARSERAPAGKPLLKNELARRGVARTIADDALAEIDEKLAAKEAAERFLRRRHRPKETEQERQQALLRHLASRGFSGYLARQAIENLAGGIELAEDAFELEEAAEESEGSAG
jgi:regulatory protein